MQQLLSCAYAFTKKGNYTLVLNCCMADLSSC